MQLLSNPQEIKKIFSKNFSWCTSFSGAVAWASPIEGVFEKLLDSREKIKQLIVGIHFYQTHPDFIKKFIDDETVHFILQPRGTFHPKMFLFEKDDDWRLIVGSANLTQAAFSKNAEVCLCVSNEDAENDLVIKDVKKTLNEYAKDAEPFTKEKYLSYESIWKGQQKRLDRVAGIYGDDSQDESKQDAKPIFLCSCLNLSWNDYFERVKDETGEFGHYFEPRKKLLENVHSIFQRKNPTTGKYLAFSEFSLDDRKLIAGTDVNYLDKDGKVLEHGLFGSMTGAGKFKHYVIEGNEHISRALRHIPRQGDVSKNAFDEFVYELVGLERVSIGTATRLLAMKRPDTFVCIDRRNTKKLCKDFGISNIYSANLDMVDKMDRYWNQIICRLQDSVWWNVEKPDIDDKDEFFVWNNRAAFLDSLFYSEKD